jgi:hypothetical protein
MRRREIGLRHAAKGVIGERRLVAARDRIDDKQSSISEPNSKAPPVTRRDKRATRTINPKAGPPAQFLEIEGRVQTPGLFVLLPA